MRDAPSAELVQTAVVFLIALVLSVSAHEYGHAFVADRLGDRLPRHQGRVTLNPIAHVDPLGTLLFPLMGFFMGGFLFGWGRPVQVNPLAFTRRLRMKTGHLLVAAAGPAMNVALAMFVSIVYVVLVRGGLDPRGHPSHEIRILIQLNFILAAFNLIPCPPLDGGTVLAGVLPDERQGVVRFLQRWGFAILLGLLLTGALGILLGPVSTFSRWWIGLLVETP